MAVPIAGVRFGRSTTRRRGDRRPPAVSRGPRPGASASIGRRGIMIVGKFLGKTGRGLAVGAAILGAIGLTTVSRPADAGGGWGGGGISPGAAVGLGLGAFALGSVLANPYYYNRTHTATTATTRLHQLTLTIRRRRIIPQRGAVGAPITITITFAEQRALARAGAASRKHDRALFQAGLRASASINERRPSAWLRIALIRHSFSFSPITTCELKGGSPSVSSCSKTGARAAATAAAVS
jgi:hypothetical protein